MKIVCLAQHHCRWQEITHWLMHLVMANLELRVYERYYAQHPTLKPVYGKSQPVIGGKFSSSYRTMFDFEITHGLRDFETTNLNP